MIENPDQKGKVRMQEFELKPTLRGFEFEDKELQLTRSTGLDTLISQNEDLAARLRVSLKNLAQVEMQNQRLSEEMNQLALRQSALQDQLLVWNEKESLWQERIQSAEDSMNQFKARFPEYQSMEEKIERYRRYHDRIKTQVKPYIQELKKYSESLLAEIDKLQTKIEAREADNRTLSHKVAALEQQIDQILASHHQVQLDLSASFEQDKAKLLAEIHSLSEQNIFLQGRSERLDQVLEKQDSLENEIIALRSNLADAQKSHEAQAKNLREAHAMDRRNLAEKTVSLEMQLELTVQLKTENEMLQQKLAQTEEQLASLRFLWSTKSEELDKLRLANQSLEKLNTELSIKMNSLTKGMA